MKAYLELIRIDLTLALRDKVVIFFTYLFPFVFFLVLAEWMNAAQGGSITYIVSMVLLLGILGNGLFGAGMRTVTEREQNILRRFKVAPISPAPILIGSVITGWLIYMPAVVMILAVGYFVYGMRLPDHPLGLLTILTLGIFAFRSLGLILASVVNSMQEINILVQLLYMPMLFLSGATFPLTSLPGWAQVVAQYLPATYLVSAFQGALLRDEALTDNLVSASALVVTLCLSLFISTRIFRWEKGEKVPASAKLWVLAVLAPFLLLGTYQAYSHDEIRRAQVLYRHMRRAESFLVHGARIFTGDGEVIESGSVLVSKGRIARIFRDRPPPADELNAEVIEASGKTLLPGLIDTHVHLAAPGGVVPQDAPYAPEIAMERALAAYLYSGVTGVRTLGDPLTSSLKLRRRVADGEILGAELFVFTPMFTTAQGHGTEYFERLPAALKTAAMREWVRLPVSSEQAQAQVAELAEQGVDGIKVVLESGWGGRLFERLDSSIFTTIAEESRRRQLPLSVHTGDARDVGDAVDQGAASIEHGSLREALPRRALERLAEADVYYDPTLSVAEALVLTARRDPSPLRRALVQQVTTPDLLEATLADDASWPSPDAAEAERGLQKAIANLQAAATAGVALVTGTDSGNFLLPHGPALHREMQLWVEAGLSPGQALTAATYNAARLLGVDERLGRIREGLEATFLIVDGDPLANIADSERISLVVFKGERISRSRLFDQ